MEEYESRENRDVENSELLMAEYNAAFQDLNSVVEVTIVFHLFLKSKIFGASIYCGSKMQCEIFIRHLKSV